MEKMAILHDPEKRYACADRRLYRACFILQSDSPVVIMDIMNSSSFNIGISSIIINKFSYLNK